MPFPCLAYNVMIACPSDIEEEFVSRAMEVIHEWNAVNSETRQIVLLPIHWSTHASPATGSRPQEIINSQLLSRTDLLIAVFRHRLGSPTGEAVSGTVEEITRHIESGKQAMIYFSSEDIPQKHDQKQFRDLVKFRDSEVIQGMHWPFKSREDFLNHFRKHLPMNVNRYLMDAQIMPSASGYRNEEVLLSDDAARLLIAMSEDRAGCVLVTNSSGGMSVQANHINFCEKRNARAEAHWHEVIEELINDNSIEDRVFTGTVFHITTRGYTIADKLKEQEAVENKD